MAVPKYIQELQKKYKDGPVVMQFDGTQAYEPIATISTGSFRLNKILGGGVPLGRITQIYGPFSGGKSSVTMHIMANAQETFPDKLVGVIETEGVFDPARAQNVFGVDLTRLHLSQPNSGEEGWDVVEAMLRSTEFSVIVVDSVGAMVPMAENDADFDQQTIGLIPRLMTKAMRKLGPLITKSNTALVLVNQIRANISTYGAPEMRPGGLSLSHASSIIVRLAKTDFIKDGSEVIGIQVKAQTTKNKLYPPMKDAEFAILFASGIDYEGEIVAMGEEAGILRRAGSWYKYGDESIAQGKDGAALWLKSHPDVRKEIEDSVNKRS